MTGSNLGVMTAWWLGNACMLSSHEVEAIASSRHLLNRQVLLSACLNRGSHPVMCCAATASIAIHRIETKHIIDSALSPGPIEEDVKI